MDTQEFSITIPLPSSHAPSPTSFYSNATELENAVLSPRGPSQSFSSLDQSAFSSPKISQPPHVLGPDTMTLKTPTIDTSLSLNVPQQEIPTPSSPTPSSQSNHRRKNHRGGAKEQARRERKALGPLSPSTPSSTCGSVSGAKKTYRAGVKIKARRERQALYKMTGEGMMPLDPDEYDSDGFEDEVEVDGELSNYGDHDADRDADQDADQDADGDMEEEEERREEHDTPSLTYDSDEHEEEHEEPEAVDVLEVQESAEIVPELELHNEEVLPYEEKGEEEEVIMESKPVLNTAYQVSPAQEQLEVEEISEDVEVLKDEMIVEQEPMIQDEVVQTQAPVPRVVLTPVKKHPVQLVGLMRPIARR